MQLFDVLILAFLLFLFILMLAVSIVFTITLTESVRKMRENGEIKDEEEG